MVEIHYTILFCFNYTSCKKKMMINYILLTTAPFAAQNYKVCRQYPLRLLFGECHL